VRARKVTDGMAIRCAHSIADFAERRGISPDDITARMDESEVFAIEAADVAMKAIEEGVARVTMTREEAYARAKADIAASRALTDDLMRLGHIAEPPESLIREALEGAIAECRK